MGMIKSIKKFSDEKKIEDSGVVDPEKRSVKFTNCNEV